MAPGLVVGLLVLDLGRVADGEGLDPAVLRASQEGLVNWNRTTWCYIFVKLFYRLAGFRARTGGIHVSQALASGARGPSGHTCCPPLLLQKIFKFYIFDHRTSCKFLRELFMQKIRFDGLILTKLEGVKK